jgi:hypothetical protein
MLRLCRSRCDVVDDRHNHARGLQHRCAVAAYLLPIISKRLIGCHARGKVIGLVHHLVHAVDAACPDGEAQYFALFEVVCFDMTVAQGDVKRMLFEASSFSGIAAFEATLDHQIDGVAHFAGAFERQGPTLCGYCLWGSGRLGDGYICHGGMWRGARRGGNAPTSST